MRRPRNSAPTSNDERAPCGGIPTSAATPPWSSVSIAASIADGAPLHSIAASTPCGSMARTRAAVAARSAPRGTTTKSVAPKAIRKILTARIGVERNDPRRLLQTAGLQHVDTDAADAEHRHPVAGPHLGHVAHDAIAGAHRAADERRLRGDETGGGHDLCRAHRDATRERRDVRVLADRATLPLERCRSLAERCRAVGEALVVTGATGAARRDRPDDHRVAHRQAVDIVADRTDHAGRFVSEHHRRVSRTGAVEHVEVAVADTRRPHVDLHLSPTRFAHDQVVDNDDPRAVPHCCAHAGAQHTLADTARPREN